MTDKKPIEKLKDAIQEFVNSLDEHPRILTSAVVVWEDIHFDDDGDQVYRIDYASTSGTSLSGTIGLLDFAKTHLKNHVYHGAMYTDESEE